MDFDSFKNNAKRDLKAQVTPRKMLRAAFVPQTRGLLNPIRDIFGTFVMIIAQLFAQASLIPQNHPVIRKEITGLNALWTMILDGSSNIKFRRDNTYQIVVFYGVVGMLIFGTLGALSFLLHFSLGQAHAQTINNTQSLFDENGQDNGPNWINTILPFNTASGTGLPFAMGGMLEIYNSALLALGTVLALYQIATLFVESAHHGTYGGNRYSQLYAPIRMVIGIGLLIPISNGYNSAEIIAIDMAKMGSGLASNVWTSFQNSMTLQGAPQLPPPSEVNDLLEKLIVDETCMVAAQNQNQGNSNNPTWLNQLTENTDGGYSTYGADGDNTAESFTIRFDNQPGDGYCGTLTIPAQQSYTNNGQMSNVNYFEQSFVNDSSPYAGAGSSGNKAILNDIWQIATTIYNNTQGSATGNTSSYDPEANVFCTGTQNTSCASGAGPGYSWDGSSKTASSYDTWQQFVGTLSITTGGNNTSPDNVTSRTEFAGVWLAAQNAYADYEQHIACGSGHPTNTGVGSVAVGNGTSCTDAVSGDWTKAGFLFLRVSHDAEDLYNIENPNLQVTLPDPEVMQSDLTKLECPAWYNVFAHTPYTCSDAGKKVQQAVQASILDVTAAVTYTGLPAYSFDTNSSAGGNDGGKLSRSINHVMGVINPALAGFRQPAGGVVFGQSIFNVLEVGRVILAAAGGMFMLAAAVGASPFTVVVGNILAGLAASLMPIGFSLAIMVPLMPAARFLFGIFAWLLTLFEAMVAMPLVALISIKSDGEGLFAHGLNGWMTSIQMMFRPVLMVFGLLAGCVVFDTLAGFINDSVFGAWTTLKHSGSTGILQTFLSFIGFMYFYATVYALANLSFGMINTIPDRVLQWTGLPTGLGSGDQSDSVLQGAASQGSSAAIGVGQAVKGIGGQAVRAIGEAQEAKRELARGKEDAGANYTQALITEYQAHRDEEGARIAANNAHTEYQGAQQEATLAQQNVSSAQQNLTAAQHDTATRRSEVIAAQASQDDGRINNAQMNLAAAEVREEDAQRDLSKAEDNLKDKQGNLDGAKDKFSGKQESIGKAADASEQAGWKVADAERKVDRNTADNDRLIGKAWKDFLK